MKENKKHTPGTWRQGTPFLGKDTLLCLSIVDDGGRDVATIYGCGNCGVDAGFPPDDEARGHAALIAAAPDLLAACEGIMGLLDADLDAVAAWQKEADAVRAAIAKAKGK